MLELEREIEGLENRIAISDGNTGERLRKEEKEIEERKKALKGK